MGYHRSLKDRDNAQTWKQSFNKTNTLKEFNAVIGLAPTNTAPSIWSKTIRGCQERMFIASATCDQKRESALNENENGSASSQNFDAGIRKPAIWYHCVYWIVWENYGRESYWEGYIGLAWSRHLKLNATALLHFKVALKTAQKSGTDMYMSS